MSFNKAPLNRPVKRTCDYCKKILRKVEMYEPINSTYKKLCKKCFDLWLDDKLDEDYSTSQTHVPNQSKGGESVTMDYQSELKKLKENETNKVSDYWKPKAAQYKVKALSEIEDGRDYEEEGKAPQKRKQIKIAVGGKEIMWSMPFGTTPASTYGQLVSLGAARGKLMNEEFTVVVTGDGKTKRFAIVN